MLKIMASLAMCWELWGWLDVWIPFRTMLRMQTFVAAAADDEGMVCRMRVGAFLCLFFAAANGSKGWRKPFPFFLVYR